MMYTVYEATAKVGSGSTNVCSVTSNYREIVSMT